MATFIEAASRQGFRASTLTDNAMVYTVRHGRHRPPRWPQVFEAFLRRLGRDPEELRPNHPTTCGKVERFQQTLKEMAARPARPARHHPPASPPRPLGPLQPSPGHTARCPTARDASHPLPANAGAARAVQERSTHDRIRHDGVDKSGTVTLRVPASSATSASAEPTREPTSSCSSRTSTYASSTPSPANCSASSPSTPTRTTTPK